MTKIKKFFPWGDSVLSLLAHFKPLIQSQKPDAPNNNNELEKITPCDYGGGTIALNGDFLSTPIKGYKSNYQDFLKTIAIISMIIDHIGLYIFPEYEIMRVIGRTSMPIFCFFVGYNFHNKPKIKIFIIGIILYIYSLILFKQYVTPNILISIFLGQYFVYYFKNELNKFFYKGLCHVIFVATCGGFTRFLMDYGTVAISIIMLGYIARQDSRNLKLAITTTIIITLVHAAATFHFSPVCLVTMIILMVLEYIFMTKYKFEQEFPINLKIISRNVLYIYAIHVVILQFIYIRLPA